MTPEIKNKTKMLISNILFSPLDLLNSFLQGLITKMREPRNIVLYAIGILLIWSSISSDSLGVFQLTINQFKEIISAIDLKENGKLTGLLCSGVLLYFITKQINKTK